MATNNKPISLPDRDFNCLGNEPGPALDNPRVFLYYLNVSHRIKNTEVRLDEVVVCRGSVFVHIGPTSRGHG